MRGIVVEINNKDAVILTDEGIFAKIGNKNFEVGQAVQIKKEHSSQKIRRWIAGAASMAAAVAFCTIGTYAYYTPTDYVSLDVNPSVEYSVNMFDRILDVKAVNDAGEEILSGLDLNHEKIEEAVKETLNKLIEEGYLADDPDGEVIITTSNDEMGEAKQMAAELKHEVQNYLDNQEGVIAEVEAEAVKLEKVREARDMGVTPGKLNLVEKLQDSTSSAINKEEWLSMPVKEINKAIKENRKHENDRGRKGVNDSEDSIDRDWPMKSNTATGSGVFFTEKDAWQQKNTRTDRQGDQKDSRNSEDDSKNWNNRRSSGNDNWDNANWQNSDWENANWRNHDWNNTNWDDYNWGYDDKEDDRKRTYRQSSEDERSDDRKQDD